MDKQDEIKWCPTQSGTYIGYQPEWLDEEEWKTIHTIKGGGGIPSPRYPGAANSALFMFDYAEAMALAWSFAAMADSQNEIVKVRVQPYKIVYDCKARKTDPEEQNNE